MPPEGKSDMERIGIFKELGYISIGDKYTSFFNRKCNKHNKLILVTSSGWRTGAV